MKNESIVRPSVFISYSWDSSSHVDWVLRLAKDLIEKFGIKVILDQFELKPGKDLPYFMEDSLESANKVILILTPEYKKKAEARLGGVGSEYSMITEDLYELQVGNNKFIPVLRSGNKSSSVPRFIKSRIYHPMTDDSKYHLDLHALAMVIYDTSKVKKPALGPIPNFDDPELDPIVGMAHEFTSKESLVKEIKHILNSPEGFDLASSEIEHFYSKIRQRSISYNDKTTLNFDIKEEETGNDKILILSCRRFSVLITWSIIYGNDLDGSKLKITYWKGRVNLTRDRAIYFDSDKPSIVQTEEYNFSLDDNKNNVWKSKTGTIITNDSLVSDLFIYLIESIKKEGKKG